MGREKLKRVDCLRHELKALRFMLDRSESFRGGSRKDFPARDDFQCEESKVIYDAIAGAKSAEDARRALLGLDLDGVDVESFLSLSGAHYHAYPALVRERGEAVRQGKIKVEAA